MARLFTLAASGEVPGEWLPHGESLDLERALVVVGLPSALSSADLVESDAVFREKGEEEHGRISSTDDVSHPASLPLYGAS